MGNERLRKELHIPLRTKMKCLVFLASLIIFSAAADPIVNVPDIGKPGK